jgi:heme-degrading monooxygenase HmoA
MFQVLTRQFKGWMVAITLTLSTLFLMPAAAIAVSLAASDTVINVATVYKVNRAEQAKTLSDVLDSSETTFPKTKGFLNASILNGQDESEVIALSQWKDLSSFQTYAKQQNLSSKNAPQIFACQVQHTETRDQNLSFGEQDAVMFSQFKMKPDQKQSDLAMIITQEMPGVLQMIPGLQWAAMCPSIDQSTIALIARWQSRNDFQSLGKEPGFDKETNYWQTYANNEHGLYDVVKVIEPT